MNESTRPVVYVVSDGRGQTCSQVLRAALVQFEDQDCEIVVRPEVREAAQVQEVVREAHERDATVFYTLVVPEARRAMTLAANDLQVPTVDVLGPSTSALHDVFEREPSAKPGLFYASERERIDRQEAIDYTLKHDDGQRTDELNQADVVLVGVSRAAKSSTCFFLAFQGLKAANVPLVFGVPVPRGLAELDSRKVIALNVNVSRLLTVRQARASHLGDQHLDYYTSKREVANEVLYAAQQIKQHGWRTVEASYLAVEEIARQVMRLLRE